jgi:hypothetical protein
MSLNGFDSQIIHSGAVITFTRDNVEFWNDSTGIIAGYNSLGLPDSRWFLARTTNAGNSWSLSEYYDAQFPELQMMNELVGYAFDFTKTIDGGITWYRQEEPVSTFIGYQYLHCPSLNVCYTSGSTARQAHIARTLNGGGPLLQQVGMRNLGPIESNIGIAPNPCTDQLSILNTEMPIEYSVFNFQGQAILTGISYVKSIDVSMLMPGMYIIKTNDRKGIKSGKFVKVEK